MEKLKENWRKQLWYEKLLHIIGFLAAIGAIVLPLLDLLGICDNTAPVYIPLLAVLMLIQAYGNRRSRKLMIFSLCCAIVIAACWLTVMLLS